MVEKFQKEGKELRKEIFDLYFKNIKYINNWNLVDLTTYKIVGEYVKEKYKLESQKCSGVKFLNSLVSDKNIFAKNQREKLWEKRIAIVATLAFMMKPLKNEYAPDVVFEVIKKNLTEKDELNKHDLLQKASGWMLREYGKRVSEMKLKEFLLENFENIKNRRVLLRYAIERFSEKERKEWLSKN